MGELLRSACAKRLVNQHQVVIRSMVLRMHQWCISQPGASEGLCHWRGAIEPTVANGTLEPLVAADLDLVNMFGNAKWPCIRQALRAHFPEASAWTEWQHQSESVTSLTSPPIRELCRVMCWSLGKRATRIWVSSSPTPSRPRASVMNGLLTGKCLSDASRSTHCSGPWAPPSPLLGPPEDARRTATSRASRVCFAHQSAGRSLRGGTRRTCMSAQRSVVGVLSSCSRVFAAFLCCFCSTLGTGPVRARRLEEGDNAEVISTDITHALPEQLRAAVNFDTWWPRESCTIRPETNSNDFGGFWNQLEDSNSIFVVAKIIFERFEFLVRSCECAVPRLCPRISISNVVVFVTIHDDMFLYVHIYKRCLPK